MASSNSAPNGPVPSPNSSYYGFLFNSDKQPTKTLNALLRAIGQHIIDHIGDKNVNVITSWMLAEVYKPFSSDIDTFLLESSPKDLSNIWAVMGYEHHLVQPHNDRYSRPALPALTLKGFVSWLAVQLLVDPTENVPVVQYAVRHWKLRNPDTGEPFPEVPVTAFPAEPDRSTEQWEENCGKKLLKQAEESRCASSRDSQGRPPPPRTKASPPSPGGPRYAEQPRRGPYEYVRVATASSPRERSGSDQDAFYTTRVPYPSVTGSPRYRRSPEREHDRDRERDRERDRDRADRTRVASRAAPRHPHPNAREVTPRGSRRRSFTDYHGKEPRDARDYGPHSASDPHLKTTQATSSMPPPPPAAASGPSPSGPVRPDPRPYVRRTTVPEVIESENDTDETDSETGSSGDDHKEARQATQPQRRRTPRPPPRPTAHGTYTGESIPDNGNRLFRERGHNGNVPPISPGQAAAAMGAAAVAGVAAAAAAHGQSSPRMRPTPQRAHVSSSSGDPRRRSQGGISELVQSIPVIGTIVGTMAGHTQSNRRPHSHDSRYYPARLPRRHSDDDYYSSDDDYEPRKRTSSSRQQRVNMEAASRKDQDRAKTIERELRRRNRDDYGSQRDRDRDRSSRNHLRRPEPTRRTSSHADAERRVQDRDHNREYYDWYGKGRGPSPLQKRFAVPMDGRSYD